MKFDRAIIFLLEGYAITRPYYFTELQPKQSFFVIKKDGDQSRLLQKGTEIIFGRKQMFTKDAFFNSADVLAEDWVVVPHGETVHAKNSEGPVNCKLRNTYQNNQTPPVCERCGSPDVLKCLFFEIDGKQRSHVK